MDNSYDIVIIGAGSVGVPAAWAMARAGVDVLVIDQFASSGQGSNKAAIGGIRATHSDPAKIRIGIRSLEIVSTWQETYGHNIEWMQGGYSFVAYRESEEKALKNLLEIQHRYGLNIDWYDKKEFLEIIPALNPNGLRGGTFSPEDGGCSPLLLNHALYTEATRAGAQFLFGEHVIGIDTKNERITGVKTDRGYYKTNMVLNAAGAWANELGSLLNIEHPVTPESHEGGITEPVATFVAPMVVDIRPSRGSANYYFYQHHTGQVVFCITPEPSIPGFDRRETSAFLPMVSRRMVDVMPKLANLRVRRTWRGLYPMSPDGSPLVGWSNEIDGYLVAIGMCGQGFMLGPGLGELLARMVTQDVLSEDDQEVLDVLSPYRSFEKEEALK
jgi:sarcosine oxidase subunit beta